MPETDEPDHYPFLQPRPARLTSLATQMAEIEASGIFTNFGPKNQLLEQRAVERLFDEVGHCVSCVNATTALILAIRHEMAGDGGFALLPSFTFAASAHAAIWNGLTPLFCDVDPETWLPSAESEVALLDELRDEIAVVIPQATFGNCLDLDRYAEMARFYSVPVVVDAAPAIGSQDVDGRQFGTASTLPIVFSMHATKTFATDEGGLVYSTDPVLIEDLRAMSNFGFGAPREATMPGLNGKLSELGAVLALAKLDEIDEIVDRRAEVDASYREALPEMTFQSMRGARHSHQFVPVHVPGVERAQRDALVARLGDQGIEVAHYFSPHLAEHRYFAATARTGELTTTQAVADGILSLPMHDGMSPDDAALVSAAVQSAWTSVTVSGFSSAGSETTPA